MSVRPWTPPMDMPGADRPPDRHVGLLFDATLIGGHVHVTVRSCTRHPSVQVDHSRGKCGEIVMEPAEWLLLRAVLADALDPAPVWIGETAGLTHCTKVGPAGARSEVPDQRFIEIAGWPW